MFSRNTNIAPDSPRYDDGVTRSHRRLLIVRLSTNPS
jgi:hypothetical protein